jgi:hypothetical protein
MRDKLKREILSTRDACFLFEPEMMMRSEGTTSYEMAQDTSGYDLGKIFETAEMVGKAPVSEIADRLSDPDSGVRFWAVTGLLNNLAGSKPHLTEISQLLNDSSQLFRLPQPNFCASWVIQKRFCRFLKNGLPTNGYGWLYMPHERFR